MILWCLFAAIAMSAFAYGLYGDCFRRGNSDGPPPPFQPYPQLIPPTQPCRPPSLPRFHHENRLTDSPLIPGSPRVNISGTRKLPEVLE